MTKHSPITLDEIDAALNGMSVPQYRTNAAAPAGPAVARSAWVASLTESGHAGMELDALAELAAERDPAGPAAAIRALLRGLIVRHQGDDATLAALVAIERVHLPDLLDGPQ